MTDDLVFDRIRREIDGGDVVLFMKGTAIYPQCGFSSFVVQALNQMGVQFKTVDVLTDPEIRDGIKQFSNWPTIPQLYIKGEFVGGCDIVRDMYESGELTGLMSERGVEVSAPQPAA
jgi:monothiol glutaredoxin